MIVTTIDEITATRGEPIVVNIGSPVTRAIVNSPNDTQQVSLSDSYQVVPYTKRVTTDFKIPASLQADLNRIDNALLNEINGREIAIVDAIDASKSYTDGVQTQLLTNVAASYISNADGANYILKSEATQLALEYNTATGTTLATFQDLYNTGVTVGNAQATYTQDIQALVDNDTVLASRATSLEASTGSQKVSIDGLDTITLDAAGDYTASMSKLITTADGVVSGWSTNLVGDGTDARSDFTIQADIFKVQGSTTGYTPFKIDTTTGKISFTGDVRFEGLGIDGGSTTIDGGKIDTVSLSAITANLGTINAGVMYSSLNAAGNGPSTPSDYAMKIDLNNGEIHIV